MARCGCGATLSDGFPDRYARAVAAADALFVALGQHPRCQVARRPAGTNVVRLHVKGADAAALPDYCAPAAS